MAAFLAGGLGGAAAYAISQGKKPPTADELWTTLREAKPLLTKTYTINITQACTNQEFVVTGTSIFVVNPESPTVPVYICFNDQDTESLDLTKYRSIHAPFWRFFITNAIGTGTLTVIVNKFSAVLLSESTANIRVSSSGVMLPVDIQAQYVTLDVNTKQWGGTVLTGRNISNDLVKLDVALSTLATQATLASLLAKLDVALSTRATEATVASLLAKLDVTLSTRASQTTLVTLATEATLATKVNKAIVPIMYNASIVNADTEYSQALPTSTKRFKIVLADGASFRLAFVTGKVATPTAPYWTQPSNLPYEETLIEPSTLTLYFACAAGTKVAQIVAWS